MKSVKLTLLIIPLLFFACKKDPPIDPEPTGPVMPPLTHQGLNTFGCYIDGELFVANEGESVWSIPPVSGRFDEDTRYLVVQGTRYRYGIIDNQDVADDVRFRATIFESLGTYDFNIPDYATRGYTNTWEANKCDYYYSDKLMDSCRLMITYLNEEKNIISGTFYMNLINTSCEGDTLLKITDGRFDFHY